MVVIVSGGRVWSQSEHAEAHERVAEVDGGEDDEEDQWHVELLAKAARGEGEAEVWRV